MPEFITIVAIDLIPFASFTSNATIISVKDFVNFTFNGEEGDLTPQFSWNFGDGFTSGDENPVHQFLEGGKYNVTLVITDADGDTDETWMIIEVKTSPTSGNGFLIYIIIGAIVIVGIFSLMGIVIKKRRK